MRSAIASSSRIVAAIPRAAVAARPAVASGAMRMAARSLSSASTRPRINPYRLAARQPQQVRTMFIQTETTPNEDSLKFIPGVPVTKGATYEFLDQRAALKSPLATRLLNIEGIVGVFYGPDFVTCNKDDSYNWNILKPEVFAILMEHFSSGASLFREEHAEGEGAEDTRVLDTDSDIVAMIKELLETRVRPAIQEDGGDIEYRGFNEESGTVFLKLMGSCRGCSSSEVTLKNGIERMLMHYVPEVQAVEQFITDEEKIANEEFAKLEARLEKEAKEKEKKAAAAA